MRVVLLGGPPGIGKSTAAHHLLEAVYRSGTRTLVQWIDVEMLWRHQPWRVTDRMRAMLTRNLEAVVNSAVDAGVDLIVVTWVFSGQDQCDTVVAAIPSTADVTLVQLTSNEATWRARFDGDPLRQPISPVDVSRFGEHVPQRSAALLDTSGLDGRAVGVALFELLGLASHADRSRR